MSFSCIFSLFVIILDLIHGIVPVVRMKTNLPLAWVSSVDIPLGVNK